MLTLRPNGSYLLRPSSVNKHDMVLSVNQDGRIQHHLIVVFGSFRGAMLHGIHRNTLASLLLDLTSLQLIDPLERAVKLQVMKFVFVFFVFKKDNLIILEGWLCCCIERDQRCDCREETQTETITFRFESTSQSMSMGIG